MSITEQEHSLLISMFQIFSKIKTTFTCILSEIMYLLLWMNLEIASCLRQSSSPAFLSLCLIILKILRSPRRHNKTRAHMPAYVVGKLATTMAMSSKFPRRARACHCTCKRKYLGLVLSVLLLCYGYFRRRVVQRGNDIHSSVNIWVISISWLTVNSAAMNMGVQIPLQDPDFNSRSGIAGSMIVLFYFFEETSSFFP